MLMAKEKEGKGGGIDGNLHPFLLVNRDETKLSPSRESRKSRWRSGGGNVVWWEWNGEERSREGGMQAL
jgi:hypothetical protein